MMMQFEYEPEVLIEAVKKRPGIWDNENINYRSKSARHKLWLEVVREVAGEDVKVSKSEMRELELQLQKKWKSIRDCFHKYVTNPRRTRKPYVYCRHLDFILKKKSRSSRDNEAEEAAPKQCWKHLRKIKLTKMSSDEEEDDDDVDFFVEDDVQATNDVKVEPPPPKPITEFAFANVEGPSKSDDDDPDRMFLLSLLPHIKAIPDEYRLNVKMDLMQVLRNATNFHVDSMKMNESSFNIH
ncbi:uncharacterized protein LOC125050891 [Pieris napi]|uniref:uncharacterized protein LOC125050891 n=1 Tax=Pieris napi TaxID=78633 RepID=UPI001FB99C03|nr:uncharacterized protein LOC125050891 [Pieris napi]